MTDHDAKLNRSWPRVSAEPDAEALRATWLILEGARERSATPVPSVDAAWDRLSARLFGAEAERAHAGTVEGARISRLRPWLKAAAVVGALFIGGGALWSAVPASFEAQLGERARVVLPGGSVVDLNAGSTLRWARGFAWIPGVPRAERVVHLEGEGYFEVTTDGRPFQVETADARVRVLGTRFNVRVRPGEGTSVTVDEGSVEVHDDAAQSGPVVLVAGQRVIAGSGTLAIEQVDPTRDGSWRAGGFAVTDAPLSAVLDELERRFSVRLEPRGLDPVAVRQHLSLYYSGPVRLEGVLDDIATALGLRYRAVAGGWELYSSQ
jgi:ferric-dicitrate binding protein FerR (iron transport regulator)